MIDLAIDTQPNDETCGATCLHAVYRHYGLDLPLTDIIDSVERSISGGTLSSLLGKHALMQGFDATILVNNMKIFDPTWFKKSRVSREILATKLKSQSKFKHSKGITQVTKGYLEYLELGGNVRFKTLDVKTLKYYFDKKIPILTGLSSTYLYRSARECFTSDGESYFDDIQGEPCGHFVVLCGYDEHHKLIVVADPFRKNPFTNDNYYKVSSTRIINAILLGVLTFDATLLIIEPKQETPEEHDDET
jgi:hypothetical protein